MFNFNLSELQSLIHASDMCIFTSNVGIICSLLCVPVTFFKHPINFAKSSEVELLSVCLVSLY